MGNARCLYREATYKISLCHMIVSYNLHGCQLLEAMNQDSGIPLTSLQVDGGMTANSLLMQLQADILQIRVGKYSAWSLVRGVMQSALLLNWTSRPSDSMCVFATLPATLTQIFLIPPPLFCFVLPTRQAKNETKI